MRPASLSGAVARLCEDAATAIVTANILDTLPVSIKVYFVYAKIGLIRFSVPPKDLSVFIATLGDEWKNRSDYDGSEEYVEMTFTTEAAPVDLVVTSSREGE